VRSRGTFHGARSGDLAATFRLRVVTFCSDAADLPPSPRSRDEGTGPVPGGQRLGARLVLKPDRARPVRAGAGGTAPASTQGATVLRSGPTASTGTKRNLAGRWPAEAEWSGRELADGRVRPHHQERIHVHTSGRAPDVRGLCIPAERAVRRPGVRGRALGCRAHRADRQRPVRSPPVGSATGRPLLCVLPGRAEAGR